MNYHIGRLVLSSLCVGVFAAADIWWCSFCRLKHYCSVHVVCGGWGVNPNTQRTENKTTDVVIHQHSRRLLKMDILMSETCWVHNKWNKIASDIKLVFHSSTITMMHGPINIRWKWVFGFHKMEFCTSWVTIILLNNDCSVSSTDPSDTNSTFYFVYVWCNIL